MTGEVTDAGYVIHILNFPDTGLAKGPIDNLTGRVRFDVTYDALCFKPFRNEVLDTLALQCTSQGFFAEAGPFTLFVSRIHIPGEFEFRPEDTSWASSESGAVLRAGSAVRLRIMGVNPVSRSIAGIGTINEPHLGPIG